VNGHITLLVNDAGKFNSLVVIRARIELVGSGGGEYQFRAGGGEWADINLTAASQWLGFCKVENQIGNDIVLNFQADGLLSYRLTQLVYFYTNINPFTGELAP